MNGHIPQIPKFTTKYVQIKPDSILSWSIAGIQFSLQVICKPSGQLAIRPILPFPSEVRVNTINFVEGDFVWDACDTVSFSYREKNYNLFDVIEVLPHQTILHFLQWLPEGYNNSSGGIDV